MLFGWDDENTNATLNANGTYDLPAASFPAEVPPNGVRVIAAVLEVALQCTMAVDSGGPDGVSVCSGGANDGARCEAPSDGNNDICFGGTNDGNPCQSATDCPLGTKACNGGTNVGNTCTVDGDCPKTCTGGSNAGNACTVAADCPKICTSGANVGNACTTASDCPKTCTGGDNAGNACTGPSQCPGGGTCDGACGATSCDGACADELGSCSNADCGADSTCGPTDQASPTPDSALVSIPIQ